MSSNVSSRWELHHIFPNSFRAAYALRVVITFETDLSNQYRQRGKRSRYCRIETLQQARDHLHVHPSYPVKTRARNPSARHQGPGGRVLLSGHVVLCAVRKITVEQDIYNCQGFLYSFITSAWRFSKQNAGDNGRVFIVHD